MNQLTVPLLVLALSPLAFSKDELGNMSQFNNEAAAILLHWTDPFRAF